MKTFANILWALTFGWLLALVNALLGVLFMITIIFIPVGLKFFELAKFSFAPFGYDFVSVKETGFKVVLNIIWAIFFGWEIMLSYFATGVALCMTIIFIPFGIQYFKVGLFILMPLGKEVRKIS